MDHKNKNSTNAPYQPLPKNDKTVDGINSPVATVPASLQKIISITAGFIIGALVIAALYWGKDILIPLALAILLAFLVDPLVMRLRKRGLPQWLSIALVVTLVLGVLSGAATYLGYQLGQVSQELPQYHGTIQKN